MTGAIQTEHLSHAFTLERDVEPIVVLEDISISLPPGSRTILLGANGAGKSTLLRILAGKRLAKAGTISVNNVDPFKDYAEAPPPMKDSEWALNPVVRRDVPVSDLLTSIGGNAFPDRRKLLVDLLDIDEDWHMHAVSDGRPPCELRKLIAGERRRVQLAMGLMRPWTVLLLDEVTIDLDVLVRSELLDFLRKETESRVCTIVYCTHIFDGLAGWPTHLLKVSLGKVMAFDTVDEIERISKKEGYGSANSALYEVCLAWLKEDREERGRRGLENRKKWSELPEKIRGPILEHEGQKKTHTRVERWRIMPTIE